jgi:ribonuclease Z
VSLRTQLFLGPTVTTRELILLGTASQVPTRHRNHNGYLLLWDGTGLLFDPGEGTQRQMTTFGLRAHQIHRICVTHFHGDHCLGLPGILQRMSLDLVPHEVSVHYPASGQRFFDRLRYASIYHEQAQIRPTPHDTDGVVAVTPAFTLSVARLDHRTEATGYRLQEPDGWTMHPELLAERGLRGPVIGEILRNGSAVVDGVTITREEVASPRRGQSVAVVMDTRRCQAAIELARGVDLLVCESTYLDEHAREAHDHGHLTAKQAATIAMQAGARRLLLTHFSQRYPDTRAFLAEAKAVHPDVVVAEDGLRVAVPPRAS